MFQNEYPKNVDFREKRGFNFWKMERYEDAKDDFQEAINLEPTRVQSWINLLRLLLSDKKYVEAEQGKNRPT